jgi:hypothetical protein
LFALGLHPGQGMHIASMWIIAYNLLEYATTYCASIMENGIDTVLMSKQLNNYDFSYSDIPKKKTYIIPPYLNSNQVLTSLSSLYDKDEQESSEHDSVSDCQMQFSTHYN